MRRAFAGIALLTLAAALGWAAREQGRRSVLEARPECAAALALRENLLARRGTDGAYAFLITLPGEPWTTGEASLALATYGAPEDADAAGVLARFEAGLARRGKDGALAGWAQEPSATIAAGEASAYAVAGLAALHARYGLGLEEEVRRCAAWLAAAQNPDGSFSFVVGHPEGSRASSTQDSMLALVALGASGTVSPAEVAGPLERAAEHAGKAYDASAGGWSPGPGQPAQPQVPGLSEFYAWLLLEARDVLADAGRPLPPAALAALRDHASRVGPSDRPLEEIGLIEADAYSIALRPGEVSTRIAGHYWSRTAWRALALARLARSPDVPRTPALEREDERLRASLSGLPAALRRGFTFQVAESLTMAATLRHGDPADPAYGSLYAVLREARRRR